MAISIEQIKKLREITSASIIECKKALEEAGGDLNKAKEILQKWGLSILEKKESSEAKEGRIDSYVHFDNRIGVLIEVNCDTDFVSRSPEFSQFTKDLAMQIAACNPLYIQKEDVPPEVIEQQKDKESFYQTHCLLEQNFIKDPNLKIKDYLGNMITKFKENIVIRRFVRYQIGK